MTDTNVTDHATAEMNTYLDSWMNRGWLDVREELRRLQQLNGNQAGQLTGIGAQLRNADQAREIAVNNLDSAQRDYRALEQSHQLWKDELTSDLHEEADRRDFCEDFDTFMEEHGLPGRERDFRVTARIVIEVSTTVVARSEQHAVDIADDDAEVRGALREAAREQLSWADGEIDNVEAERE